MTVSQRGSKYNMSLNPVYAVDFTNQASGKRLSATKRRVRFRFGFSDADAIAAGEKGVNCRGEEHDVSLVWSLTSGKRLVMFDGEEIHFSMGKITDSKFETSWPMAGGHLLKLIAYAAPPLRVTPGFRQFDLLLDGCSFFDMPRIYQLGNVKNRSIVPAVPRSTQVYNNYSLPETERRHFAERPSGEDHRVENSDSALDVQPVDMLEASSSSLQAQDLLDSAPNYTPETAQDEFTPAEAPPPTIDDIVNNQIMSAYAPPSISNEPYQQTFPALANEPHTHHHQQQQQQPALSVVASDAYPYRQQHQAPPAPITPQGYYNYEPQQNYYEPQQNYYHKPQQNYYHEPQPNYYHQPQQNYYNQQAQPAYQQPAPVSPETQVAVTQPPHHTVLTMEPLCVEEIEERESPAKSEFDQALNNLVNLSDISETRETPEQRKTRLSKVQPVRSKPLPPTKPDWTLGMNAKLGEIKEHAPPKTQPAKEIMRTHAFDPAAVQAGMMVVYGATNHYQPQQQQAYHPGFGYQQQQRSSAAY